MPKISYGLYTLLTAVFFTACANIKSPTGGPDDLAPPKVKKTIPNHKSVNYTGKTIVLYFDENIDAQNLRQDLIISPLIESQYNIVTNKKTITIRFKDNFKENTTYNINFGEGIKDVTKGNNTKNLTLAFSTGPYLDSLAIKGLAYDFLKGTGLNDVSIQLYSTSDTNTITSSKPLYYAETNPLGFFSINNIKAGTYNLYAFLDLNKNFIYDNEKESIAFISNVEVKKALSKVKLGLTRADTKAPILLNTKQENESYLLSLNEGVEHYNLKIGKKKVYSNLSDDRKTIRIFDTFNAEDSIRLYYQLTDSSGNTKNDSTKIFFENYETDSKKNTFGFSIEPKSSVLIKNDPITILFNKPIRTINEEQIKVRKDTTPININDVNLKIDSTNLKINIINEYTIKDSLTYTFKKGAFISIYGDSSLPFKVKFRHKMEENYGTMGGIIICKEPHYIFQLIDSKGRILDSKINPTKFLYTYLEPGNYQLKVISDVNNNGRWDPTNIYKNIPPEPVYYYKEKINLRANWELLDLKFEAK